MSAPEFDPGQNNRSSTSAGAVFVGVGSPMSEDAVLMGWDFDGCGVRGVGWFLFPEAQVLESEILGRYPHGRVPGVEKGDDPILLPAAFEGEEAEPLLKGQCAIVSAPEGGVRVPALDPVAIVLCLSRVHGHRIRWALGAEGQPLLRRVVEIGPDPVSYTHLTLPTICSV